MLKGVGNLTRFTIFFLSCALIAAVATPWVYLGVQWAALHIGGGLLEYLSKHPFHRYFNRVLQVSILIGIWPLLKRTGFNSWQAFGLKSDYPWRRIGLGLGTS